MASAERGVETIGHGIPTTLDDGSSAFTPAPRWLLIATPDDRVAAVADELAEIGADLHGVVAFHASGALPGEVLGSLRRCGASVASLHPLRSFASPRDAASSFDGTLCFCEGDAADEVAELVRRIGGEPVLLASGRKGLYHAAASMTSNALVALLTVARRCMVEAGVDSSVATRAIADLAHGTTANVRELGLPDALTGPIERGDLGVVAGHLEAIEGAVPETLDVYLPLARATVDAAVAKGSLSPAEAEAFRSLLGETRP